MNIFHRKSLLAACIAAMMGLHGYAQKNEASPRLSDYFSPATTNTMSPDSEGFIQRWLLLEPIDKPNRSNTTVTFAKHLQPSISPINSPFCPKTGIK